MTDRYALPDRFALILSIPGEIGIKDELSGDVNAMICEQNNNTIGFVGANVNIMNRLQKEKDQVQKLNNILEGFLGAKGYTFDDVVEFLQERTEAGLNNE